MNGMKEAYARMARRRRLAVMTLLLCVSMCASATWAHEANLTRFGPQLYEAERGGGVRPNRPVTFRAMGGPAELVLRGKGSVDAKIKINGVAVATPKDFRGVGEVAVPLVLNYPENTIEVNVRGGKLSVRVTQMTEANINVRAQMYFGVNTSNFNNQLAFYDKLGIDMHINPAGPEECKTFARSLGFADDYLIRVALSSFVFGVPPWIDTVEFRDEPNKHFSYRDEPPYANLNHVGMAYASFSTTDLDGDYAYLKAQGIDFVSAPTSGPDGERFVFLKDQDGTFLKLVEEEGAPPTAGADLVRLVNTNMNVTDLERSREFYRLLGFTEAAEGSQQGAGEFANAHGFKGRIEFKGADVSLPGLGAPLGDDKATLQLREWKRPFDGAPPYAPPVNHLGIDRIALYVDDLNATIAEMKRLGFNQLGPIGGGDTPGSVGIVFFYDPDGIKVEFWGPVSEANPDAGC